MPKMTQELAKAIARNPWAHPGAHVVQALQFTMAQSAGKSENVGDVAARVNKEAAARDAAALHMRLFSGDGVPRLWALADGIFDGMNPVAVSHFSTALRRIAGVEQAPTDATKAGDGAV